MHGTVNSHIFLRMLVMCCFPINTTQLTACVVMHGTVCITFHTGEVATTSHLSAIPAFGSCILTLPVSWVRTKWRRTKPTPTWDLLMKSLVWKWWVEHVKLYSLLNTFYVTFASPDLSGWRIIKPWCSMACANPSGQRVTCRVVSSEISGNFPRKSSGNLFQFFRKFPEIC